MRFVNSISSTKLLIHLLTYLENKPIINYTGDEGFPNFTKKGKFPFI